MSTGIGGGLGLPVDSWRIITNILGLIYFTAWSVSFYPQAILNYRRKSASGLSQDFSLLNPLGFLAYTTYNLLLRYSPLIRAQYSARHEGAFPEVSISDLGFGIHAFVLSAGTLGQTYWYGRRSGQRVVGSGHDRDMIQDTTTARSYGSTTAAETTTTTSSSPSTDLKRKESSTHFTSFSLLFISLLLSASLGLAWTGTLGWEWLDLVYSLGWVKLYISIAKWLPQLILNATHRSTLGFSIHTIILDLIGSLFSFLELALSSIFISGDVSGIWGNPGKLGLSGITMGMDGAFLIQWGMWGNRAEGEDVGDGTRGEEGQGEGEEERRPLVRGTV